MPWSTSDRRAELPPDWEQRKRATHERDGWRCTWVDDGRRCTVTDGLECDHEDDPHDHSLENLRTLCEWHHARHTAAQAADARRALPRRQRPRERHPGVV